MRTALPGKEILSLVSGWVGEGGNWPASKGGLKGYMFEIWHLIGKIERHCVGKVKKYFGDKKSIGYKFLLAKPNY